MSSAPFSVKALATTSPVLAVDRQMELAPGSAAAAVSLFVPLALSEQFQPRAVDNQMPSSCDHTRSPCGKLTAAPAECGVIRNAQIETQQAKHAAGKRLSLAQAKVEHRSQHQHHLNGQIGVRRLSTWRAPPWRLPLVDGGFIDPQRQVTASPQSCLVVRPIADAVARSWHAMTTRCIELEWHASSYRQNRRPVTASVHQRHAGLLPTNYW